MLTVARSFVGGRPVELHVMRRKKYARSKKRELYDIQYNLDTGKFHCPNCNNGYGRRDTMLGHYRYECGKAPRYKCPYCNLCSKKTSNIYQHVRCMHPKEPVTLVKLY
ncbi:longitudinals lacking protein, isoforms A/B/D/L-like [Temnothorax curvispinosus]|uniref:Longitudinals lacking protein, isoforms A/B/D/L-like n=1 Tax=Temnothorax curvispinosus TaxID=300111 RepID=A0A6J1R4H3_9HYME|nr:longitudinals lacking protein, isoforms A/B/D/L-like [Temnothorax curvispinosus]